jgi:hypothetical protein
VRTVVRAAQLLPARGAQVSDFLDGTIAATGRARGGRPMNFRSSLCARLVSLAVTVGVSASGIAVAAGAAPWHILPYALLAGIACGIVGLVLGVNDHPAQVALFAIVLPMALWPFVIATLWIAEHRPELGWAVAAVGAVPLALTMFAGKLEVREKATAGQAASSAHG